MIGFRRSGSKTATDSDNEPREARTAELLLHLLEITGLLQTAQRCDDRIKEVQQHQHAVLVNAPSCVQFDQITIRERLENRGKSLIAYRLSVSAIAVPNTIDNVPFLRLLVCHSN